MAENWFTSKLTMAVLGFKVLAAFGIWFLSGTGFVDVVDTLPLLHRLGFGLSIGAMSLLLVVFAKKVSIPRRGWLFVGVSSACLVPTMFLWFAGALQLAVFGSALGVAFLTTSASGILSHALELD